MNSVNPGLLYYRYYFDPASGRIPAIGRGPNVRLAERLLYADNLSERDKGTVGEHFEALNKVLLGQLDTTAVANRNVSHQEDLEPTPSELTVAYPGLLIGLGYNHQISSEKAINAGFSFDHTTGLPYLPGSTVKGAIRAAFPGRDRVKVRTGKAEFQDRYALIAQQKERWLRARPELAGVDLEALEREIFHSVIPTPGGGPEDFLTLPTYSRCQFHDALFIGTDNGNKVFGPDNITPHLSRRATGNVPDRYLNPTPVSLLRVLPGVRFSFAFVVPESYPVEGTNPTLSPAQLRTLFIDIIKEYGIGAKTRLGYGRFEEAARPAPPTREDQARASAIFQDNDFAEAPAPPLRDQSAVLQDLGIALPPEPEPAPEVLETNEAMAVILSQVFKGRAYFKVPGQDALYIRKTKELDSSVDAAKVGQSINAKAVKRDGETKQVEELIFDWTSWKA
jgi:CRISPR-associated protein Cmr6